MSQHDDARCNDAILAALVAHVIETGTGNTQPILRLLAIATVMAQNLPYEKRIAMSEIFRDSADEIENRRAAQRVEIEIK
jgi:hypothetical protein